MYRTNQLETTSPVRRQIDGLERFLGERLLGEHLAAAEAWAEAEGARLLAEMLEELPALAEGLGLKRFERKRLLGKPLLDCDGCTTRAEEATVPGLAAEAAPKAEEAPPEAPPEAATTEETMSCTDEDSATAVVETASTGSAELSAVAEDPQAAGDDPELTQAATKLQAAQRGKVARKEVAAKKEFPALQAAAPKRAPVAAPRPTPHARGASEARARAASEREVLDILVSQVSALIGRGGRTVRAIEEMTDATVTVKNAKAKDAQPQVVILGRRDAVAKAKTLVLAKLPIVDRMEIRESQVGAVIGVRGAGVRELEQRTGACISIAPAGQFRDVVISAPSQRSVDAAMDEIDGLLAAGRRR